MTDTGKTNEGPAGQFTDAQAVANAHRYLITQIGRLPADAVYSLIRSIAREEIARASARGGEAGHLVEAQALAVGGAFAPSPAQAPEKTKIDPIIEIMGAFGYLHEARAYANNGSGGFKHEDATIGWATNTVREALRTAEARIKELEGERDEAREIGTNRTERLCEATDALADIRVHLRGVFAWTSAARHGIKNDPDPTFSLTNLEAFEARTRALLTDPSPTARDTDTPAPACTCTSLPEPPNDDCPAHGLCKTCGAPLTDDTPAPAPDKALVEALEWYADPKNWANVVPSPQERITTRVSYMGMDVQSPKGEGIGPAVVQSVFPARAALAAARKVPVTPEKGDE